MYQWVEKDFGLEELAIFHTANDKTDDNYDDIEDFTQICKKTVRIQEWKHRMFWNLWSGETAYNKRLIRYHPIQLQDISIFKLFVLPMISYTS